MKTYLKCLILVTLVASALTFPKIEADRHQMNDSTPVHSETASPAVAEAKVAAAPKAEPVEVPKPVEPAPIGCGPHEASTVYNLITAQGVPRTAAIQILGSWKSESGGGFDQCQKVGDGGVAWGLNSWHPGRRQDMPQELRAQVAWAINTELPRDCQRCHDVIMNPNSSVWEVRQAIKSSTRWGVEGGRWLYADQFATMF